MLYRTGGFVVAFAVAAAAHGAMVAVGDVAASTEQTGATFAASLEYQFNGGTSGTLTLGLTNTSPGAVGGYLTGVVFNIDSADSAAAITLTSSTSAQFHDAAGASAMPFGPAFMGGASLSAGNWEGGGQPFNGVAIGATITLEFAVSALDAGSLSHASFLEGPYAHNFIVRFRGMEQGQSDKVPAIPTPAPAALLGLAAVVTARRRRH